MVSADIVLAIDPGREKCGLAVVHKEQGVICKAVVNTNDLAAAVSQLATTHRLTTAVIGDGTTSRTAQTTVAAIAVNDKPLTIIPVNEYRSTDEARTLYWQDNPPKGLKRLLPLTMQVPPIPVDDYVAVILARRFFNSKDYRL